MLVTLVADRRRLCASGVHFLFDDLVQHASGLANDDMFGDLIKDGRCQFASSMHAGKIGRVVDADAVFGLTAGVGFIPGSALQLLRSFTLRVARGPEGQRG